MFIHTKITILILCTGLIVGCGDDTDGKADSTLGTIGFDAGEISSDAAMPQEPQDGSTEPEPIASIASGQSSLVVYEDPKELHLLHSGVVKLRLPLDGFQVGSVPEIDPAVNYNPFYIWSNLPSSRPSGLNWLMPIEWGVRQDGDSINIALMYENQAQIDLVITVDAQQRFKLNLITQRNNAFAYIRLVNTVDETEGFYGLGEVFDDVNHRGKVRSMQIEADFLIESANNEAHVPIPLLLGSSGWGVFYKTYYPSAFGVANERDDRVDFAVGLGTAFDEGLTFYLFTAAHPLDLTKHYYDITGALRLPAEWAYGPWVWRDENQDQAQVINDLETIRSLDLATSGYWIDRPYASGVNSFDFNPEKFPDPQAMVSSMHAHGFRFALWHCSYVGESQASTEALHNFAVEQGYYPPQTAPIVNPWGRPIDLTNPEAYAWWQSNLEYYTDLGVEGYKLDYVEDFVIGINLRRFEWLFSDGSTERTMHKYYQFLFHKVYADMVPDTGGFILGRSATFGSQTNGTIIWPGDLDANFTTHREMRTDRDGRPYTAVGGLPAAVVAGLSLGPSGFPFFGSDTGGYRHAPPNKEVFTRWFQHTALSSVMQIGTNTNDVAWEFKELNGFDDEMLDWYRIYTRLHLRLFPYAWTYARSIGTTGRPITRPYGLQYPELNQHPSDVYFFGDDLLVAPVITEGARDKLVPFPPGEWFDWWTGQQVVGGEAQVIEAPLSTLPLFLRGGGIIPMLRPTIDTMSPVSAGIDIESYANDPGVLFTHIARGPQHSFTLFDDTTIEHSTDGSIWRIEVTPGNQFNAGISIIAWGAPQALETVLVDGAPIPVSRDQADPTIDAAAIDELSRLHIMLTEGVHEIEISLGN
jgi:alpha-D-xyloside xylohydrolase